MQLLEDPFIKTEKFNLSQPQKDCHQHNLSFTYLQFY